MTLRTVLALAAASEAATGLALIIHPPTVVGLLLGADVAGAGIAIGRVAGVGLLSLGVACWPGEGESASYQPAVRAMFTYNLLVALYFVYLWLGGERQGALLLPALVLHAVFTILLARGWWGNRQTEKAIP